ncbi:alpha/beta hydrolase [Haliscomenobacter hydrossis]|uniref:Monoacylglycerol lipase n=1 Tax=Haliscomenobacter hydrossis (strain ATCC 27775 / DSM 1100 / LMG 10767 / O) TaxID=760192 RepID=F4KZJ2_HALH1|nr:alpha/beta hydrolase [Haliscomenobacter hydrossis]AEE49462.1 alpha/beta hydrolase fold protein [Haliscomenobacter hydrossis DSM 1100]
MPAPRTLYLNTSDNVNLRCLVWDHVEPRAVIALVHGMGEHCARYTHVADYFNQQGYALMAYDQRGHGESGGPRGHSPSFDALLDDLALFLRKVEKEYPNTPIVLYGHSMGGNVVLNYTLRRKPAIRGLVASSPWIELAFAPPAWKVSAGRWLKVLIPKLSMLNELDIKFISRDPQVVAAYQKDPLVHTRITPSMGYEMMQAASWLNTFVGEMPVPTLLFHGTEDGLTSHLASRAFAQRVQGPLTFVEYQGLYHETHNEPEKAEVLARINAWLDEIL